MPDPVAAYIRGKQLEAQRAEQQRRAEEDRRRRAEEEARKKEEEQRRAEESRQRDAAEASRKAAEEAAKRQASIQRQAELEKQAKQAREMAEGKGLPPVSPREAWLLAEMPLSEELKREAASATERAQWVKQQRETQDYIQKVEADKSKYDIPSFSYTDRSGEEHKGTEAWESYKSDVKQDKEVVEVLTSKKLAPFVTAEGGKYSINLDAAIKAGVSKDILTKAGISESQIEAAKTRVKKGEPAPVTLERAIKAERISEVEETVFKRTHTELPDKQWMSNKDLADIKKDSPEIYQMLTTKGYDETVEYIDDYNRQRQTAIDALSKHQYMITTYVDGKPVKRPAASGQIDLIAAYDVGLEKEIEHLYGKETVDEIKQFKHIQAVQNVVVNKYGGDLGTALLEGFPVDKLKQIYEPAVVDKHQRLLSDAIKANQELKELKARRDRGEKLSASDIYRETILIQTLENKARMVATGKLSAEAMSSIHKTITEYIDPAAKYWTDVLPVALSLPLRAGIGAGKGVLYAGNFVLTGAGLLASSNPKEYAIQAATGMVDFFKAIPAKVVADPEYVAELVGMFIGPAKLIKMGKSALARLDPAYVPSMGIKFQFSTGKLPTRMSDIANAIKRGKLTEVQIANAIYRAQKRLSEHPEVPATARLGRTNITLTIEPTPWNKQLGFALWHSSPMKNPYVGKEFVVNATNPKEPALFTSPQAAPRFALMSASGISGKSPSLVLIYTKDGVRVYPAVIRFSETIEQMRAKGFEYLGSYKARPGAYSPIKYYRHRFENELMLPNGMKLYKVQNFRSRIFGAGAGEFVTTVDGWVMPIYRFAEKGANVPKVTLPKLAAVRVAAVAESVKSMMKRRRGFEVESIDIAKLVDEIESTAKKATEGKKGAALEKAYTEAVDRAMIDRLRSIYEPNRAALERLWRTNPQRFEQAYITMLNRELARAYNSRIITGPARARQFNMIRNILLERRVTTQRMNRLETVARAAAARRVTQERIMREVPQELRRNVSELERIEALERPEIRELPREGEPPRSKEPPRAKKPREGTETIPREPPPEKEKEKKRWLPTARPSDKEKRQMVIDAGGAIAWYQGRVGKKDRWDTIIHPFKDNQDYLMILGEPPEGATIVTKGKGAAYATAQVLYGRPPKREVLVDSGFQDIRVIPKGGKKIRLEFKPDPERKTKGDITIGRPGPISEQPPAISERPPRITPRDRIPSSKIPRITPPTPRLR